MHPLWLPRMFRLNAIFYTSSFFFFSYRASITSQNNILFLMALRKKQQLVWPKSLLLFYTPFSLGEYILHYLHFFFLRWYAFYFLNFKSKLLLLVLVNQCCHSNLFVSPSFDF